MPAKVFSDTARDDQNRRLGPKPCSCGTTPILRRCDGADHHGIDVFMRCSRCGARGRYFETECCTVEVERMAIDDWNSGERDTGEEAGGSHAG